jgi:hypothetical protein
MSNDEHLTDPRGKLLSAYTEIALKQAVPRLDYYKARVERRRIASRATSVIVIVISLFVIPLATNFLPEDTFSLSNKLIISTASLLIGLISGLQELFKWESTWRQYTIRIIEIESAIALWQLELLRTTEIATTKELNERLFDVTKTLLQTVDNAVLAEVEKFFASSKREETQKNNGNGSSA